MEVLLFQFTQGYLGLGSTGEKWIEVKKVCQPLKLQILV